MDLFASVIWTLLVFIMDTTTYTTSTRARVTPTTMTRNIEEENGAPVMVETIQNTLARLPCNVTAPLLDDRVALVIWYKMGSKTPIYSVDTRDANFTHATHWSDELYRERLSFNLERRTGILIIKETVQDDTGEYRCRVDFQKSPTRNSKVNLTVINPPESLIILDSKGITIKDHVLGPYNEGAVINITCVALGGQPQPRVTWWHGNALLDNTSNPLSDRRVGNVLSLGKLKRKNIHMQLTCQATNNNLTLPITSTVTLDMNLRPLLVKLQGENRPLSADNSYQLSCVVIGSRPTPTITWWKGSTPMKNTHEIVNPDGNMTTSILTFTPCIEDRGKYLSCRAEQSMIPESGMEDGWKLDIYHVPVVSLELGTNSMNATFREGIDVFFECNIKSNPWVSKVSWRHNDNILENNIAEGIVVANQSLVLQNVSRARSGIYTCVGTNREGDGESNPVHLDIRFAPVCRQGQRTVYSTGRHETAKVACEIDANPVETLYVWKFNATLGETIDIPASLIAVDHGRSIAHYTPMTENDYGTLLCWASNEIGDQSEPCVYTIMPAGEPDPLINCTLLNQTSNGFQIECMEGFDGGLQQDFIMEVYVNGTTRHPKIYKSKVPYFEVHGLIPGAGYNVFLIAHNTKGRSNATILQVYTLKDPEKQTVTITYRKLYNKAIVGSESVTTRPFIRTTATAGYKKHLSLAYAPVMEDIRPVLGILLGIVGSISLVALIIVIIVRTRGSTGNERTNYTTTITNTSHAGRRLNGLHNGHDIYSGRANCHVTSSLDSIDKNPDIIPQDGHEEDDEWTTATTHNHAYATAALAEQNAVITSSYDNIIPTYAMVEKKSLQNKQHLQQLQTPSSTGNHGHYVQYSTLIPLNKMSVYSGQQQHQQHHQQQAHQTDSNHGDLNIALDGSGLQQRLLPGCSATLGRHRQTDLKRIEPNIYSQIDLAHHPMYSASPLYPTNTITGVTMSHPSQLATFSPSPPSIFSHKVVNTTQQQQQHTISQVQRQQQLRGSNKIGGASSGGGGLVYITADKVPSTIATTTTAQHNAPTIMCATQKRLQSPPKEASNLSLTSTPNNLALSVSSSTAINLLALQQGNSSMVGVTSTGSTCNSGDPYANDSTLTPSSLLKTVPEEVVRHQLNNERILIAQDQNHPTCF